MKPGLSGQLGHDLHAQAQHAGRVVDQFAGVTAVGPDEADGGEHGPDDPGQQVAGVAVLHVGR
jgi:hypothetical protein